MGDWLILFYPWTKVLHVISVISWMAGLLYLPRLFVYNAENSSGEHRALLNMMAGKLLRLIMRPAMMASWAFGLALVLTPGIVDWSSGWAWVKAGSVIGMTWFHFWCAARHRDFIGGSSEMSGRNFRIMNEVPTVLMIVIVAMVIARPF